MLIELPLDDDRKLKEAIETAGPPPAPGGRRTDSDGFPDYPEGAQFLTSNRRNGHILLAARASTISNLISCLEPLMDRPIVDKTGLTGTYAFKLEATPEFRINNNPESSDISVFTAVQEQLGLKLEAQKAPVEILVVDHIEKPSGN